MIAAAASSSSSSSEQQQHGGAKIKFGMEVANARTMAHMSFAMYPAAGTRWSQQLLMKRNT